MLRVKRLDQRVELDTDNSAERVVRRVFRELVGRRTGIVKQLQNCPTNTTDFPLKFVAGEIANARLDLVQPMNVGGAGREHSTATLAALGEGLERYSASCPNHLDIRYAPAVDLSGDYLAPHLFARFSETQRSRSGFPFQAVGEDVRIGWIQGELLSEATLESRLSLADSIVASSPVARSNANSCWLPAAAVMLPYVPTAGEPSLAPSLSTGLSCGISRAQSVLGGILEIVERDALANMWLLRRTPQRIPHSTVLRHAADLLPSRSIERLAAFDVTSDIDIPTVVVVDRWPDPSLPPASRQAQFGSILSVGSACHPNATRALRKAIIEAGQGRIYVRQLQMQQEKWTAGDSNENVSDFAAHARYYTAYPELINEAFRFLIDCQEESLRFSDATQEMPAESETTTLAQLGRVATNLNARGHRIAWTDLTLPESRKIPLHVVRVLIPSLLPLHGHHHLRFESHPRLQNHQSSDNLSPYPHPFP